MTLQLQRSKARNLPSTGPTIRMMAQEWDFIRDQLGHQKRLSSKVPCKFLNIHSADPREAPHVGPAQD